MRHKRIPRLERAKARLLFSLGRTIKDKRVLEAMARVPREEFVPGDLRSFAYENGPLPIGYGQTISQPLIIAIMTEALALVGTERVLEVGTGSGYQAALLSFLAKEVISVERIPELAERASLTLERLGFQNVRVHMADPNVIGYPKEGPYDAIIVTASAPRLIQSLIDQLKEGGRMVLPVGQHDSQELMLVTKVIDHQYSTRRLGACRFVPLIGPGAWSEDDSWTLK